MEKQKNELTEKKPLKNLTNCSGVEFLRQTNKIRKVVAQWLKETKILELRKRVPKLEEVTDDMSVEERRAVMKRNDEAIAKQASQNISDMLDLALETHAEETLIVLGLLCFIEPEDIGSVKPTELLINFAEMMADKDVMSFFTSLMKLDVMTTSK